MHPSPVHQPPKTRRSLGDYLLFGEAWLALGVARLALLCITFRRTARSLGLTTLPGEPAREAAIAPTAHPSAPDVGWAVQAAARRTPWQSACLAQALTATWMLKRRGGSGVLYLGVRHNREANKEVLAHAWLRSGPQIVTGGAGHELYTIIARFGWGQAPTQLSTE